jgi:hypothetical protein
MWLYAWGKSPSCSPLAVSTSSPGCAALRGREWTAGRAAATTPSDVLDAQREGRPGAPARLDDAVRPQRVDRRCHRLEADDRLVSGAKTCA